MKHIYLPLNIKNHKKRYLQEELEYVQESEFEINKSLQSGLVNVNFKDINTIKELCKKNKNFEADFDILTYLNSGSCGVVYEGEMKSDFKNKVALKFLVSNNVLKSKREKFDKREIQITHKLRNKNIINLYGIYEVSDIVCMVIEYAEYGDIENFRKLIQKETLNETLLAYITRQILNALFHCKQCNIAHLDVKPQNLLFDEHLNIKLADYSVSYEIKNQDDKVILPKVGTLLFMAPEILGKKEIYVNQINKVDSYSLGVALFYLAFNHYPYNLTNCNKNSNPTIPKLKKHSDLFRNFLQKLLVYDISLRLSIEEALEHPWIRCSATIFEEKEKMCDLEKFLINLVNDNIPSFNSFLCTYNVNELL